MVLKTKCPSCGIEDGPCLLVDGQPMFHIARQRAAYPTTYEYPDCGECRALKDAMVNAQDNVRGFRPPSRRSRSRWPKDYSEEISRLERYANLARAKYELHLAEAHKDETHQRNVDTNLAIVIREGRLKP